MASGEGRTPGVKDQKLSTGQPKRKPLIEKLEWRQMTGMQDWRPVTGHLDWRLTTTGGQVVEPLEPGKQRAAQVTDSAQQD